MTMYRQGDVLIVRTEHRLTDTAARVAREGGRLVLARGEATGHAHAIDSTLAEMFDEGDGRLYLHVIDGPERVRLIHEQHDAIALPPGLYEVRRQREYSPEAIRPVMD
jgi:hypothetical protein